MSNDSQQSSKWIARILEFSKIIGAVTAIGAPIVAFYLWGFSLYESSIINAIKRNKKSDFVVFVRELLDEDLKANVKAIANQALEEATFVKNYGVKITSVDKAVKEYIKNPDSGYTYQFRIDPSNQDKDEYRFYADKARQSVVIFVLGKERNIEHKTDFELRVDGTPLRVHESEFHGKINGLDITSSLNDLFQTNIHSITVQTIRSTASPCKAHLIILVKNNQMQGDGNEK